MAKVVDKKFMDTLVDKSKQSLEVISDAKQNISDYTSPVEQMSKEIEKK